MATVCDSATSNCVKVPTNEDICVSTGANGCKCPGSESAGLTPGLFCYTDTTLIQIEVCKDAVTDVAAKLCFCGSDKLTTKQGDFCE